MLRFFAIPSSLFFATVLFFGGCARNDGPSPADTVMGDPTRPATGSWVPGDVYAGGSADAGRAQTGDTFEGDPLVRRGGRGADGVDLLGDEAILETIYFGFDEYSIAPSERPKLEAAAEQIRRQRAGAQLVAQGRTDWHGTTQYNLGLGDRRANAVKTYLVQIGVPANQIDTLSLGKLDATPDAHRDSPEAKRDRRVDLFLIEP